MHSGKFAVMTASLLVRKGEAVPSIVASMPPRPALVPSAEEAQATSDHAALEPPPFPHASPQTAPSDKLRRIMVSITQDELEKLEIAAIKRSVNRHDIVRSALDDYFRKLSSELSHRCTCIDGGSCCSS